MKLDIYKCPFFKFTKNFPEKMQEYEKYENRWCLSIEIINISKQLKENPFQSLLPWRPF